MAPPNTAVQVWVKVKVAGGKESAPFIFKAGTTPSLPGNVTPPQASVQVEQLDDPLVSPNCLFRVTPILGAGENPVTVEALEGYSSFGWGVSAVIFRLHEVDTQGNAFMLTVYDSADLLRPVLYLRQPLQC
jgi:hypothetical protein